jgi:hypothetical protein
VGALDAHDAAEMFAKDADRESADYTYARGGGHVTVRPAGDGSWCRFKITVEVRHIYHARAEE